MPMIIPPAIDNNKPVTAVCPRCSFRSRGDRSATQSGPVLTNTTELATLVYSKELIHVAKWAARKMPEKTPNRTSVRVKRWISSRYLVRANGSRIKVAKIIRQAAIARDGICSLCAKRMMILPVETARIAKANARGSAVVGWVLCMER